MLSCFARGVLTILGTLIRGDGLVVGRFRAFAMAFNCSSSQKEEHQDQGSAGCLMKNLLVKAPNHPVTCARV